MSPALIDVAVLDHCIVGATEGRHARRNAGAFDGDDGELNAAPADSRGRTQVVSFDGDGSINFFVKMASKDDG